MEVCRLRVKDVDFDRLQLSVREGKGEKDRMVPLPQKLIDGLRRQVEAVLVLHDEDLELGAGWVWLPCALAEKYPAAGRTFPWQYLFPAATLSRDPSAGGRQRHSHDSRIVRPCGRQHDDDLHACQFARPDRRTESLGSIVVCPPNKLLLGLQLG